MTATLPDSVQDVFERFVTTEYTTIDAKGQPITRPVTPYYTRGGEVISVTTGLGYPKKADDAAGNPQVSLLFSDPTGCGIEDAPMVLVQGTADVDDRDLEANAARYWAESGEKLPATKAMHPPAFIRKGLGWYYTRIYVHVRPERVWVWPGCNPEAEPEMYGSPAGAGSQLASADVRPANWDARLDALGTRTYPTAVLSVLGPDGFPFSTRMPVQPDEPAGCVRLSGNAQGLPLTAGRACLTAHTHSPEFAWQNNFQVRGDFMEREGDW